MYALVVTYILDCDYDHDHDHDCVRLPRFLPALSFQILVLRDNRLVGIVSPKDLLMRVVAKGLDPDDTLISSVMTPNPDAVPPTMTVIEALREVRTNADVRGRQRLECCNIRSHPYNTTDAAVMST